ncbi:phage regulatory CII family protein [Photobacterium minamisatsumaniensis]|uniref:phage regulatory CII family protein n=1 Tax=Photobacterium minamisatsumaniensis TaxID=2910233 RepID=UPI003D14E005
MEFASGKVNKECQFDGFTRALHLQMKDVGIENVFNQIIEIGGKKLSARTFSNKVNPSQENHHLTIQEFLLTLLVLQKNEKHVYVIEEMLKLFNLKCERFERESEHDITYRNVLNAWMNWDKERGDVQHEIRDALIDGKVSANELEDIKKEMNQDIAAMIKLRDMLEFACENRVVIK